MKENIKAPRHWPLCVEFSGHRWIPRTNGQWRGKSFHLMASSWRPETVQRIGHFTFHYFSRKPQCCQHFELPCMACPKREKRRYKAPLRLARFSVPRRGYSWQRFFCWPSIQIQTQIQVGGTAGRRVLIGLVDFQPSVAINAARIRATRRFRHADHRNRSGTDFFRAAPRNCVPVDRNFLHIYIWHPDATLIEQNARGTAGDNRVNCNRISRAAVCDIPPAPPGDSAGQKIALIATGL